MKSHRNGNPAWKIFMVTFSYQSNCEQLKKEKRETTWSRSFLVSWVWWSDSFVGMDQILICPSTLGRWHCFCVATCYLWHWRVPNLGKKVFPSYLPPDPLTKVLYELLDDMVSHKPHKCLLGWNVCKISQSKTGKQRFWRCGPIVARSSTTCHVCNPIGIIDARFVGQECVRSQSTSPRRATFSRSRPTMTSRVPVVQQPAPAAHPCPPRCRQSLPVWHHLGTWKLHKQNQTRLQRLQLLVGSVYCPKSFPSSSFLQPG